MKSLLLALALSVWKFIQANWLALGVVALVVVAVSRHGLYIRIGTKDDAPPRRELPPVGKTEKFTDKAPGVVSADRLGLWPEAEAGRARMPVVTDADAVAYLQRFGPVAAGEQKKFGLPASVLLGLSYVNSFAGQRAPAREANNYFALPVGPDWEGAELEWEGRRVRRYETAWASFRDFNLYLSGQDWFAPAKKTCGLDWETWCAELGKRRVSDVANFREELESVIRRYRLFELDE